MTLIPVTITLRRANSTCPRAATITGEQVTEHFAITPAVKIRDDDTVGLANHGYVLTHIRTGVLLARDSFIDLRAYAVALEDLPIDWDVLGGGFDAAQAKLIRALYEKKCGDSTRELPWPKWAGDPATPAISLIGQQLDTYLEHFAGRSSDTRRALKDAVAAHDPALADHVSHQLLIDSVTDTVHSYTLVYLLGVLHRVAPAAADRAARDLLHTLEYGAADELMHQWREELADNLPLQLPGGFPDLPGANQSANAAAPTTAD